MRKLLLVLLSLSSLLCLARDEANINLHYPGNNHTHFDQPVPVDMPAAYCDVDTHLITIVGEGIVDYYDVEIISQKTNHSVLYTKISGYGDIIDVSYLPEAYYRIVIHSSNNNVFEGYFKKTESSSLKNPFYHRRK